MFGWFGRKSAPAATTQPAARPAAMAEGTGLAPSRDQRARSGDAGQAGRRVGWALILRSPYEDWAKATSWFGGVPCVPPGFVWPRDAAGTPLALLAQIDLAALQPHPATGARAPGLPAAGALLIFIGADQAYATRRLTAAEMAEARPLPPPDGAPSLRDIGLWDKGSTLPRWPFDPVAFLDDGSDRPADFPVKLPPGTDWISTWGIARLEADLLLKDIKVRRFHRKQFRAQQKKAPQTGRVVETQAAFYDLMGSPEFIAFYRILFRWHRAARDRDPEAPVDKEALAGLFSLRRALAARMPNHQTTRLMKGDWPPFWTAVSRTWREALQHQDIAALPPGLRPVIDAQITDWANRRLFGLQSGLIYNAEDRSGQDLLISVNADPLIGLGMDHGFGMSIWCPRADLATGRHDRGQRLEHDPG